MSRKLGNKGEDIAVCYLEQHGVMILERNYCIRGGEIDIICKDDDTIVFCEVKLRSSVSFGNPCEAVDYNKQKRICKAALHYTSNQSSVMSERSINKKVDENYRFDIIEIIGGKVNHIKAAFSFIEPKEAF